MLPTFLAHDVGDGYLGSFLLAELVGPWSTPLGGCTRTVVAIFPVARSLFVFSVAPVVPAFWTDVFAHLAVDEERIGIGTPRATEVDLCGFGRSGESTLVEYIAILLSCRSRGCCDVAIGFAVNFTVLKPSDGRTEDEIGGSLYIAIVESNASASNARIHGVLIA